MRARKRKGDSEPEKSSIITTLVNWKNRIIGTGVEKADQLLANPLNWRIHPKHQQEALEAVLNEVGWVQQVIVNKRTGHVVDGHLRVALALRREEEEVPVVYVDLSEDEERVILATIDPLAGMAVPDKDALRSLLDSTNASSEQVKELLAKVREDHAPDEDDEDEDPSDASLLKLMDVTIPEPTTEVKHGDLWKMGNNLLSIVDPVDEWPAVMDKIKPDDLLVPFPGVYACIANPPHGKRMVMMQPDKWIAAFMLDHYKEINGDKRVRLLERVT